MAFGGANYGSVGKTLENSFEIYTEAIYLTLDDPKVSAVPEGLFSEETSFLISQAMKDLKNTKQTSITRYYIELAWALNVLLA